MNAVWPLTALFGSVAWLWLYWIDRSKKPKHESMSDDAGQISFLDVAKAASHCGAGCTLGDIVAETWALSAPGLLAYFGLGALFANRIFAVWILDFVLAFAIGIGFQYWTIKPMQQLSTGAALAKALKADAASIIAWQVGMYAIMALAQFVAFPQWLGHSANAAQPEFWFAMQIAMVGGFLTSAPVNWFLLSQGVKQKM